MIIKVIDLNKLMRRNACWGSVSAFSSQYQVLAIRICCNKKQYLVENYKNLFWWDADLFNTIDETIPQNWLIVKYKRFHKFKNKRYYFRIPTSYYHGPKDFLENDF